MIEQSSKVLVTGGSGFIGTNLIEELSRLGASVRNYDRKVPRKSGHANLHVSGDILDLAALRRVVSEFQPEFVVHLAARCDLEGRAVDDYLENTQGVLNVIEALNDCASLKRVIFASSRYVHANEIQPSRDDDYSPFTAYGASKAEGERLVRRSVIKASWLIVRPTSIWGPWFDVPYKSFFLAVQKGLYMHPRNEKIFKSYGYVGNLVHQTLAFLQADERSVHGRVFYTADYAPIEIMDLAERIRRHFDGPPIRQSPLLLLKALARTGDMLGALGMHNPPLTSFRLGNLRAQMIYDLSATARIAGPAPFDLENSVERTVEWLKRKG
jgi:nucleoside-diphosphate-sugar epimerase